MANTDLIGTQELADYYKVSRITAQKWCEKSIQAQEGNKTFKDYVGLKAVQLGGKERGSRLYVPKSVLGVWKPPSPKGGRPKKHK